MTSCGCISVIAFRSALYPSVARNVSRECPFGRSRRLKTTSVSSAIALRLLGRGLVGGRVTVRPCAPSFGQRRRGAQLGEDLVEIAAGLQVVHELRRALGREVRDVEVVD